MGKRPDYAAVVYCNLIRSVYKDIPIVIGGIEASLRRAAHYDYYRNPRNNFYSRSLCLAEPGLCSSKNQYTSSRSKWLDLTVSLQMQLPTGCSH